MVYTLGQQRDSWCNGILFCAYLLGAAVSGNVHAPNELAFWVALSLIVFIPVWCVILVCVKLHRRIRRKAQMSQVQP